MYHYLLYLSGNPALFISSKRRIPMRTFQQLYGRSVRTHDSAMTSFLNLRENAIEAWKKTNPEELGLIEQAMHTLWPNGPDLRESKLNVFVERRLNLHIPKTIEEIICEEFQARGAECVPISMAQRPDEVGTNQAYTVSLGEEEGIF